MPTNPGGVPSNIEQIKIALSEISDELFAELSLTEMWNADPSIVRTTQNAREIQIATLNMEGLADYAGGGIGGGDGTGYLQGAAELKWNTYSLPNDRAKVFQIDSIDEMQTLGQTSTGRALGEFMRMHVVPEVDADSFAAVTQAKLTASPGDFPVDTPLGYINNGSTPITAANILSELTTMIDSVKNATFSEEVNLVLNRNYAAMLNNSTEVTKSRLVNGAGMPEIERISNVVTSVDGVPIIRADPRRMYSEITKTSNGYTKAGTARNIIALATGPGIVQRCKTYENLKIVDPSVNQLADAYGLYYRIYYGTIVPKFKTPGISVITD